jgi:hypothetical protein
MKYSVMVMAGGTIVCTQMRRIRTISLRMMVFAATRLSLKFTRQPLLVFCRRDA